MKSLARVYVPQAKPTAIPEGDLITILNEGALDVSKRLLPLKTNAKFTRTGDQADYALTTVLTRYLAMDIAGVWWSNAGTWTRLEPTTIEWLDLNVPTWRNTSSGSPAKYVIRGDTLTLYPTPSVTLAAGLWAYFCQRPATMSLDTHYPFAINDPPTTEQSDLTILSECVLEYWEWKALKILGKTEEAVSKMKEYLVEIEANRELLKKLSYLYGAS